MSVFYILVPLALLMAVTAVFAFLWAAKTGQFDDLETPALRILHDHDAPDDGGGEKTNAHGDDSAVGSADRPGAARPPSV